MPVQSFRSWAAIASLAFVSLVSGAVSGAPQATPLHSVDLANLRAGAGNASRLQHLRQKAMTCRGLPYRWGGTNRSGVDCSGLTRMLYSVEGIRLPHSARRQFHMGEPVAKANLREGDLVFFNTRGPLTHVGFYIGDGKFIHAANYRRGVRVDSLSTPYYAHRFAGARRYLWTPKSNPFVDPEIQIRTASAAGSAGAPIEPPMMASVGTAPVAQAAAGQ